MPITAPLVGTVVWISAPGDRVGPGGTVCLLESMKMEHPVVTETSVEVVEALVETGQAVTMGQVLASVAPVSVEVVEEERVATTTDERLDELRHREALLTDEARPTKVARRAELGLRTARENLADLLDEGSFVEYGRFAYAAQRARRSEAELIAETPADGLVGGIGTVNGTTVVAVSYDYMVLAGTQGQRNHAKKDRLFELAHRHHLPVVLFAEGGGGRPGDTDTAVVTGLDTEAFARFAALSGHVPLLGIAAGRCFAGNAALLGCCDVIIAVEGASIGMGGPAMIEGGGLGIVAPDEVGPVSVHAAAGSVDVVVADEAAAVAVAKDLLDLFVGARPGCPPAEGVDLRTVVPADRRRSFDPRTIIEGLVDEGSGIELRSEFAPNMVTLVARIDGRPVAVLANDSRHLAGAIDGPAADKATWFLRLAQERGLALISLIDTPGFMVGPEVEATGLVRRVGALFLAGSALKVPSIAVIVRRGFGLGAQAMATGSFAEPMATLAWPSGEMGGMGLEGAVRLGFRRELDAITDEHERARAETAMIAAASEHGRALNVAAHLEIDDVVDPATTRRHLVALLNAAGANSGRGAQIS